MYSIIAIITLPCVFFALASRARADEAAAVLERGIQAHGGAAHLERTKRGHIKAEWKGKHQQLGNVFQWICEETFDLPARYNIKTEATSGGISHIMELTFNETRGWFRTDQFPLRDMPATEPLPLEGHWHTILAQLLQLRSKDTELKFLGEAAKDGRRLAGIRAVSPRAAADWYFDKSTGLLARTQGPLANPWRGQEPIVGESTYDDYREVGGVQYPMHWSVIAQNIHTLDVRINTLEFLDKINERVFAKPQVPLPQEPSAPPPDNQVEEHPSTETPARWDRRLFVATLAVGSFVAVVWLIVRSSKRRKQAVPPQ